MMETQLRQAATLILESAIRIAPPDCRTWGQAMRSELRHVEGPWAALMWALGGASVLAKGALASLFIPGRRGRGISPTAGLFTKDVSVRKAALVAGAGCIVAALLFFAAPPFRHGIQVSLTAWRSLYRVTGPDGQPELAALAKHSEAQRDAQGLAFCAVRLRKASESARLAKETVRLDPSLVWIYAVVAVGHPDIPEISRWGQELEEWDPQNALLHLISAESIDIDQANKASKLSPEEARKQWEENPAWRSAMAAAFASPKFDDYLDRLKELDRHVVSRYGFDGFYEVLSGEEASLPTYAFQDSGQFAHSLLQSGENLEARGDRRGARDKYWTVARFGQLIDSQGHTDSAHFMGSTLQAEAYKRLQTLSEKEGNADEAALFGYLRGKLNATVKEYSRQGGRWVFGQEVSRRNAAVLQISGLFMMIFFGLVAAAASILIAGNRRAARPAVQRARPVATLVALVGAAGVLVTSATIYLTFRPYWYIFQHAILYGDQSQTQDLRDFLAATRMPLGITPGGYLFWNLPLYFWAGVTLLGVIGLFLIFLQHFAGRPRASASVRSRTP